jgi:hypothetical protein
LSRTSSITPPPVRAPRPTTSRSQSSPPHPSPNFGLPCQSTARPGSARATSVAIGHRAAIHLRVGFSWGSPPPAQGRCRAGSTPPWSRVGSARAGNARNIGFSGRETSDILCPANRDRCRPSHPRGESASAKKQSLPHCAPEVASFFHFQWIHILDFYKRREEREEKKERIRIGPCGESMRPTGESMRRLWFYIFANKTVATGAL